MLVRLKRRLYLTETKQDELLCDLLEDAESLVKGYTGQGKELPRALQSVVVELAAGAYNYLGMEGAVSASEGGMSRSVSGLPEHLKSVLDRYRTGKVG